MTYRKTLPTKPDGKSTDSNKPNPASPSSSNASADSNGATDPFQDLGVLVNRGDFGRRDSQVNITLAERRSQSLRPGNGKRIGPIVLALVAGLTALTAVIWKLIDLIDILMK